MAGLHRPPRMVDCDLCGGKFRTTQALNGHKRFRHRGINNKPVNNVSGSGQIEAGKVLESGVRELLSATKLMILEKRSRGDSDWEAEGLRLMILEYLTTGI